MIIKTIKNGSAVIRIDDSCCKDVTPEKAQERINNFAAIITKAEREQRERTA
ncbi:hypothetical protein [Faecalimonas umbilicata]|jgi:hypothetical protein|uniref:Uncharacterized protein n=1 Tax=Siphoviridae sp. ctNU74 TaxID=2825471 RepID=A0A8S5NYK8_9CAUD|nr:hypothetical protein [Faecalimonas umbilicata]DAD99476.1 MAG TPA: hypothetical protein [Siphoviridae sp. ctNU74]